MNKIRIGRRLQLAFGLMLLVTVFIAGVGMWRMETLSAISQRQADVDMQRSLLAQQWRGDIRLSVAKATAALVSNDSMFMDATLREVEEIRDAVQGIREQLAKLLENDTEGLALMAAVEQHRGDYTQLRNRLQERARAGAEIGTIVQRELPPVADRYLAAVDQVLQHALAVLAHEAELAQRTARSGEWIMGTALAIGLVLNFSGAYFVTRSITQPLAQAMQASAAISRGDLTGAPRARGRDEAARLMDTLAEMQHNLVRIVSTVRQNAESVASASSQIAHGNSDLSTRTEQQASALQETAASMEQLGSTVRQNADNAQRGNQLAQDASGVAARGGAEVGQVVETMKGIQDASRRIADIIGVIDGIAFQTNILALNAAVEAARAGEQGRGFAVVAGEVRTLAQRSAEAAKEIKALIGASVQRVEQGSALVNRAGNTMAEVVRAIRGVADLMEEISAASHAQNAGVSQIGDAVTQMDQATQQNAALVEQSAAAADQLTSQAIQLVQAVAVFTLPGATADRTEGPARPHGTAPPQPAGAVPRALAIQGEWSMH